MTKARPQNWLLISFDQWRGDWLQQPWLHLPHLQRLAREGWHPRRCYTASPQCMPARASWLTGLRPSVLGVTENGAYRVPPDAPSFVRRLRDRHGYRTVLVGKTHWTPHTAGIDLRDNLPLLQALGFDHAREIAGPKALAELHCELTDRWAEAGVLEAYRADLRQRYADGMMFSVRPSVLPDALYPDLWLTGVALDELRDLPVDRPWLLWVSFVGPHEPFDVPASWRGRFRQGPIPPPRRRPAWAQRRHGVGTALGRKLRRWPEGLPPEAVEALRADYADHLSLLDAQVGALLSAVAERSDAGATAITACSDHGELLGDWDLLLKGCFLEGACRSLFLHRPPGGRRSLGWSFPGRAYGLTPLLGTAAQAVSHPQAGSFGQRLWRSPWPVPLEFAGERCWRF